MPEPGNLLDYNRYLYVRGNPLKYNDPSGHIAVCLQGGPSNSGEAGESDFFTLCAQALSDGGYTGAIVNQQNGFDDISAAEQAILTALADDPNQPVLLVGHSWGGAAALSLAARLTRVPCASPCANPNANATNGPTYTTVAVDLLLMLDPEGAYRGFVPSMPLAQNAPVDTSVPRNVKSAVNLYAEDGDWPEFSGFSTIFEHDFPGNFQNGMNHVEGALNIAVGEVTVDGYTWQSGHQSIVRHPKIDDDTPGPFNTVTQGYMSSYIAQAIH